jgi:hypothetical protein
MTGAAETLAEVLNVGPESELGKLVASLRLMLEKAALT